jgi:hypothetical protein
MDNKDNGGNRRSFTAWIMAIPVLGVVGVAITYAYVSQLAATARWGVFGTALAIAGAAALTGGIVGFLFGIPHTVQVPAAAGQGIQDVSTQYQGNTNLEQVSDWLTKIIVGVGLVQIGRSLPALSRLARNLKGPLGGQASSPAFGLALVISYTLLGFLFLYLWSRERFPRELLAAGAIQRQLDASEATRSAALTLVNQQLDSLKGGQPPTQAELNKAIAEAPESTRLLSFNEAEHVRTGNWQDNKRLMAMSIPVFRALIAADVQQRHHRPHGSLGWALKDQEAPDWQAASGELTTAITIRDSLQVDGWKLYEANRALCDIKLLEQLPAGDRRAESLAATISQDLTAARTDPYARQMVTDNRDIQAWIGMRSGQPDALVTR